MRRPSSPGLGASAAATAAVLAAAAALALASAHPAHADPAAGAEQEATGQSVTITASKDVYYYGEHLSFTVDAPAYGGEGDAAYLYITHENGRTSSPVPIPLAGRLTVSTSPSAFQPPPKQYPDAPYPTGTYTLRIEHGGASDEATFTLLDSGRIVIPAWIKDTTRLWAADRIGDATYASSIGYLIGNGIIDVGAPDGGAPDGGGGGDAGGPVAIPAWVKQSAQWWVDGLIGDDAYGAGLQYLLNAGVIVV